MTSTSIFKGITKVRIESKEGVIIICVRKPITGDFRKVMCNYSQLRERGAF